MQSGRCSSYRAISALADLCCTVQLQGELQFLPGDLGNDLSHRHVEEKLPDLFGCDFDLFMCGGGLVWFSFFAFLFFSPPVPDQNMSYLRLKGAFPFRRREEKLCIL